MVSILQQKLIMSISDINAAGGDVIGYVEKRNRFRNGKGFLDHNIRNIL